MRQTIMKQFNAHVPTTVNGPVHAPEEQHHISTSENEARNQLIMDKDASNNEATTPEPGTPTPQAASAQSHYWHQNDLRTWFHTIIGITNFVLTQNQSPYQKALMNHIDPRTRHHQLLLVINLLSVTTTTTHQMWSQRNNRPSPTALTVNSKRNHRFTATKHATNCGKTLLQKYIKVTWCCRWDRNKLSEKIYSLNLFKEERFV